MPFRPFDPAFVLAPAFALAVALNAPLASAAEPVSVFAAASLRTALDQIAADWQQETGHPVTLVYAGSSALARQIIAGAPADLFVSAAPEWMDAVADAGLIAPGGRVDLLGNRLVLIAADPAPAVDISPALDLAGMLGEGYLAMALVNAVPAGQYGRAALQGLGLWNSIAGQIAQTDNVRAALALVSTGEAPLGIVYASDAVADPSVTVLGQFPEGSHPAIVYPLALLSEADDPADADFWRFLQGARARAVFQAQGFLPVSPP